MDETLDKTFSSWLRRLAEARKTTIGEIAKWLGKGEIRNRHEAYPELAECLRTMPLAMDAFASAFRKAYGAGGRYDLTHFSDYARHIESADLIRELVCDFPGDDVAASRRIDRFIARSLPLGYTHPENGRHFAASAGLMASTILTARFPERFTDFRMVRWRRLAGELRYSLFPTRHPTYGEMIVRTGHFAAAVAATETFRTLWPRENPLWTIAGICSRANKLTAGSEVDPEYPEAGEETGVA